MARSLVFRPSPVPRERKRLAFFVRSRVVCGRFFVHPNWTESNRYGPVPVQEEHRKNIPHRHEPHDTAEKPLELARERHTLSFSALESAERNAFP